MNFNRYSLFKNPPKSYWIDSVEFTKYPSLEENIKVDIAIIGGGLAGIQIAYQLSHANLNIAVFEANLIGHGTTGYTTGKITSQHNIIYSKIKDLFGMELAQQYANANESAIREIKKIIDENNIDCDYTQESAFVFAQKEENLEKIQEEIDTASSLGISASYVKDIPFDIPNVGAVKFDNQAHFHPLKYLTSLARIINEKGIQIFEKTRIVDIEENNTYILTTSQGKTINAEKVIIASHYPFYNKHGMYYSRIYTSRSYIIGIKAQEKYPGGMYINVEDPPRSLRCVNTGIGELILVVGENHKTGQGEDMNKHYNALINFAEDVFTIEDIPYRWSTQDCMTLDGVPYIGYYTSNTPNLFVATGFQKWGMTNSTVASLIIRDLILNGESPWQDVFNPSRKTTLESTKKFITVNTDVAKHLIRGKIKPIEKEIDLSNEEAQIIEIDGNKVGAYKDENGKLHFVNTTCTHMGCELNWNNAEKSWDCPCHGSRFSYKGEILNGPAVKPLNFSEDVNTVEKLLKEDF